MSTAVLDSYAVFVYFNKEPSFEIVKDLLKVALQNERTLYLHRINWGEVYYKTYKENGEKSAEEIERKISWLPIIISEEFSLRFVKQVAKIKGTYPISYADAFAVNLALQENIPLVTGDPEIIRLANKLKLQLIPL